jgi:hypothetical protein
VIAILLATAAQFFWSRDLGGLARHVAEEPGAADSLFGDLLRLANCEPLPSSDDPLRRLVRAEALRRARPANTIWRDILRPGFFRREVVNPVGTLVWRDDGEPWPGETLVVAAPVSRCATEPLPKGDELALLDVRLDDPAARSRVAYQRAVLLLRKKEKARAGEVDPALLRPELQPWGKLLRLETGVDPRDRYAALLEEWSAAPEQVAVRAAAVLAERRDFAELARITGRVSAPRTPAQRYLLALRAVALHALGRDEEALAALEKTPTRELALRILARRPFDGRTRTLLAAFPGAPAADLSERALAVGNARTALAAAEELVDGKKLARGLALQAEIAFAQRDVPAFDDAVARLFPKERFGRAWQRDERDRSAIELFELLAARQASRPDRGWQRLLEARAGKMAAEIHARHRPEAERVLTALRELRGKNAPRGAQMVALGALPVEPDAPLPAPPEVSFEWPEPFSLLAIPAADGSLRDWFAVEERLAEGGAQ